MVRIWPWYSLRGLHIHITWFSLYNTRITCFSLYDIHITWLMLPRHLIVKHHCSGYGSPMGCYGHCIVPGAATVTSQYHSRYCFMEYARSLAGAPARRSRTANRWIICRISKRFVVYFCATTPYIYLHAFVGWPLSLSYFNARYFRHLIELVARLASPCAHG